MASHPTPDPAPLPHIQQGPAAWKGTDWTASDEWIERLDDADILEVEAAMRSFLGRGGEVAERLGRITAADFPLPRLAKRLVALRRELLRGRGFALIRRQPVERYSMVERAVMFMGLGAHLGRARSQNALGHVLGHVCDQRQYVDSAQRFETAPRLQPADVEAARRQLS